MSGYDEISRWRLTLNNLLQKSHYGASALKWGDIRQTGLEHEGLWQVLALIRGIEYGRGCARTVAAAKEIAAYKAYRELFRELYGCSPEEYQQRQQRMCSR